MTCIIAQKKVFEKSIYYFDIKRKKLYNTKGKKERPVVCGKEKRNRLTKESVLYAFTRNRKTFSYVYAPGDPTRGGGTMAFLYRLCGKDI